MMRRPWGEPRACPVDPARGQRHKRCPAVRNFGQSSIRRNLPFGNLHASVCHMAMLQPKDSLVDFVPGPVTNEEAGAMFRAALRLFRHWGVSDVQAAVLLNLQNRTFARWKAGTLGRLDDRDLKARLSNLMGIHKALRTVFVDASRGYLWIRTVNEAFGGRSALDVMLGGELTDLMRVRRYLDAERGVW
jgi:Protein of unknown function (DUF2384)